MKLFNTDRKRETLKIKLSEIIRRSNHPVLSLVTVSDIVIDKKVQKAEVIFSCFGADPDKVLKILESMAGTLRNKLFLAAHIKNIPPLKFKYDKGLDHADKIDRILSRLSTDASSKTPV